MDKFDARRNLIVNYLPNSLTEEEVRKMFEDIGAVSSCKLIVNKTTGESLGYAFVEYAAEDDAKRAISEITGTELHGKTIKVSLARQPSAEEDNKNTNVYIAGLPADLNEEQLLSIFSPFGSVVSHKILTNPDGTSRHAGFVRYSSSSDATKAIKEMAGKTLPNSVGPLTVKLAIPPASKQDALHSLNAITTNSLAGLGVASRTANVRFNPMAPSNPLLVGATASPASAVAAAISGMNAHLAQNGVSPLQPASVYVFGLQPTHTELTLYELFSPFGAILNVKLMRDLTKDEKPCKGYGFVNFTKNDDALRAVTSMNGVQFEERMLQVSFKQNKSQPQGQHAAQQVPQPSYAAMPIMGIPGMGVGIPA